MKLNICYRIFFPREGWEFCHSFTQSIFSKSHSASSMVKIHVNLIFPPALHGFFDKLLSYIVETKPSNWWTKYIKDLLFALQMFIRTNSIYCSLQMTDTSQGNVFPESVKLNITLVFRFMYLLIRKMFHPIQIIELMLRRDRNLSLLINKEKEEMSKIDTFDVSLFRHFYCFIYTWYRRNVAGWFT